MPGLRRHAACRSDPQIPHATDFRTASPCAGVGSGTSSTRIFPRSINAARITASQTGVDAPARSSPLVHFVAAEGAAAGAHVAAELIDQRQRIGSLSIPRCIAGRPAPRSRMMFAHGSRAHGQERTRQRVSCNLLRSGREHITRGLWPERSRWPMMAACRGPTSCSSLPTITRRRRSPATVPAWWPRPTWIAWPAKGRASTAASAPTRSARRRGPRCSPASTATPPASAP